MHSYRGLCGALLACALVFGARSAQAQSFDSITDFVVANGGAFDNNPADFDILLTAVSTAGLAEALDNPEASLTLFAPNDQAFLNLAKSLGFRGRGEERAWNFLVGALTDLGGGDPIPVLTDVLLYHVVPEEITPVQFLIAGTLRRPFDTLLDGATIQPAGRTIVDNDPDLADPSLTRPLNVVTGNGIIHTITGVLVPLDLP